MADALHGYRDVWQRKPVLRAIYGDFYDRIVAACVPGLTVEIGGGGSVCAGAPTGGGGGKSGGVTVEIRGAPGGAGNIGGGIAGRCVGAATGDGEGAAARRSMRLSA